jgi:GH24 family phage-related lysozyme (muramidase)
MIVVSELTDLIAEHEGKSLSMYTDTVGVPTIGYGHNLQTPISEHAAKVILADDVKVAIDELDDRMDWWRDLPDPGAASACIDGVQPWVASILALQKVNCCARG